MTLQQDASLPSSDAQTDDDGNDVVRVTTDVHASNPTTPRTPRNARIATSVLDDAVEVEVEVDCEVVESSSTRPKRSTSSSYQSLHQNKIQFLSNPTSTRRSSAHHSPLTPRTTRGSRVAIGSPCSPRIQRRSQSAGVGVNRGESRSDALRAIGAALNASMYDVNTTLDSLLATSQEAPPELSLDPPSPSLLTGGVDDTVGISQLSSPNVTFAPPPSPPRPTTPNRRTTAAPLSPSTPSGPTAAATQDGVPPAPPLPMTPSPPAYSSSTALSASSSRLPPRPPIHEAKDIVAFVHKVLYTFVYNPNGATYNVDKKRPLAHLISTGVTILKNLDHPIQCVEVCRSRERNITEEVKHL